MASDKAPAYQWYPKDYEADETVKLMSYEQEGIYRRLLDHQALHGSIPSDPAQIAMLVPKVSPARFSRLWPTFSCKFVRCGDRLVNQKLEKVKAGTAKFKADKEAAGRASAAARLEQTGNNQPNTPPNSARTVVSTAPEPASASSSASSSPKELSREADEDFQVFTRAYPAHKRQGGYLTVQAFLAARTHVGMPVLLAALEQHKRSEQWQTARYVPLMQTWLEDKRWLAQMAEPAPAERNSDDARLEALIAKGPSVRPHQVPK